MNNTILDWTIIAFAGVVILVGAIWALCKGYGWDDEESYYNRDRRTEGRHTCIWIK